MEYETPQFFRVMRYAADAEGDVVDMVSGSPDWEPPAALREALAEYARADVRDFQYPPSAGLRPLREEIAARRNVDVGRVVVTTGAGEANYLAMARALERDAGDEVLLTDPVYPYYPGKTSMLGATARYVEVEPDGSLDPTAVAAAASGTTACILVNTPNNPTGAVYGPETVRELVRIAESVDALLVVDEVYAHFDRSGRFRSALTVDSPNVVATSSFSKSLAITGFRVGYAVFPEELVAGAKTRHMLTNVASSRPAQHAVLAALREAGPDYYAGNRRLVGDRIETLTAALDDVGAEYTAPGGAFYVLARIPDFPGTMANVERLIDEAGVACMPGETFGRARADHLRFAVVTPRVGTAAERLVEYFG